MVPTSLGRAAADPQGVGSLVSRFVVGKLVGRLGASTVTIVSFLLAAVATVPFAFAGPGLRDMLRGALEPAETALA